MGVMGELPDNAGFDCIVVNGSSLIEQQTLLRDIRLDSRFQLLPVFCGTPDLAESPLADGLVPRGPGLVKAVETWNTRRDRLAIDPEADFEALVLAYLWLLPERRLHVSKYASDPQVYRHDLLSLWNPGGERTWIDRAERRGLIERDKLVDRLRHCATCGSAHLNYIDSCPQCADIDIREEISIHCFACGHVAEQDRFRRQQKLVCPKCNAALKHIGTDYDRPIETHRCLSCRHSFIEADVRAACLDCGAAHAPHDLIVRNISGYRLAPEGEAIVLRGRHGADTPLEYGAPIGPAHFCWVLQWLNDTATAEQSVVVAGLRISGVTTAHGLVDDNFTQHIESLADQLHSLLHPSDVITLYGENTAFVVLAHEGGPRLETFVEDVHKLQHSQLSDKLEIRIAGRTLPDSAIAMDAQTWLAEFCAELRATP